MINVEIGTLDKRVTILTYAETTDEIGLTHQELVDAIGHPIWARIEPARGRTYYEQYKDKVELLTKITDMLVGYRGQTYKITSVVDPYEAHVKLELMCNLKRAGDDGEDG